MAVKQTEISDDTDDEQLEINDSDDIFDAVEQLTTDILNATDDARAADRVAEYIDTALEVGAGRYSQRNRIALIHQLNQRDTDIAGEHFAGYRAWQDDHGRHVKQGENGFKILAPVTGPACPGCGNAPAYHDGNEDLDCSRAGESPDDWDIDPREAWSDGVYYFSTATVFALEQTEPMDDADDEDIYRPAEHVENGERTGEQLIGELVDAAESGEIPGLDAIRVEFAGAAGLGLSKRGGSGGGVVYVKDDGRSAADQARTLAHELAHEMLHQGPVGGDEVPDAVKEVEAEAVAYSVAEYLGLDVSGSDLYIGTWIEHADGLDGEDAARAAVRDRLETVQETAAEIIETIENSSSEETE